LKGEPTSSRKSYKGGKKKSALHQEKGEWGMIKANRTGLIRTRMAGGGTKTSTRKGAPKSLAQKTKRNPYQGNHPLGLYQKKT